MIRFLYTYMNGTARPGRDQAQSVAGSGKRALSEAAMPILTATPGMSARAVPAFFLTSAFSLQPVAL